jgi:PBSX family phage terminase large subunit
MPETVAEQEPERLGTDVGGVDPLLSPKQRDVFAQATARLNIAWGPVRSGKSVALEVFRWFEYVNNAPSGGELLMAGKTLKSLERNVLIPLKRWFGPSLISYSLGKKEATIAGRRVELEGANDRGAVDKVTGMTLSGALCNELTLLPQNFFNQTLGRLSIPGAKLFGTTNPDSPFHWLKEEYLDRASELDLRHWRFQLDDNIFLPESYVQALRAEYTGMWFQRYIKGLWVLAAGAIYSMFDTEKHVRDLEQDRFRQIQRFILDCDYGTSNPTTFSLKGIWHEETERGRRVPFAHTFREYYYNGAEEGQKTDQQFVEDLGEWLPERLGPYEIDPVLYVDPSAASFIAAARSAGYNAVPADNAVLDGIRFVSSMLEGQAKRDGRPRLTFSPDCEKTPQEYTSYVWDEKAQRRGEDKPLKERDHCPDRDRYGLWTDIGTDRFEMQTADAAV